MHKVKVWHVCITLLLLGGGDFSLLFLLISTYLTKVPSSVAVEMQ